MVRVTGASIRFVFVLASSLRDRANAVHSVSPIATITVSTPHRKPFQKGLFVDMENVGLDGRGNRHRVLGEGDGHLD